MKGKYITAVVLSAILFCTIPQPQIDNQVRKDTQKPTVSRTARELAAQKLPGIPEESKTKAIPVSKPESSQPPVTQAVAQPLTDKQRIMSAAGIAANDYGAVDYIITRESSWNSAAINYLGCIGLYQACPSGHKATLETNCPDWQTNSVCSLRQAASYAVARYGSWWGAQSFWASNGWW